MRLDSVSSLLFSDYPREVGTKRYLVKDKYQFELILDAWNGVEDCFTNANSINGTMDKVFFDFDGVGSLKESQIVYSQLRDVGAPVVPVASGKKGIHLHILFKPHKTDKEVLLKASLSILQKTLEGRVKTVDSHVLGDTRRLCRVPSTLRPPENLSYCTFLPPDFDHTLDEITLAKHIKSCHIYSYEVNNRPLFGEFILSDIKIPIFEEKKGTFNPEPLKENNFIKNILRPALYNAICGPDPPHFVRVAVTVDLLKVFSVEQVFEIYRGLGWSDWDAKITRDQIESCKYLKPYSNSTLRRMGLNS